MDAWAKELGKSVYNLGPMRSFKIGSTAFPQAALDGEVANAPGGIGIKVMQFLNEMLQVKGKQSVVYICLGSMFWWVRSKYRLASRSSSMCL